MNLLFFLFLFVDGLAAYYLYRQAFVVRSNMNRKYKRRFFLMMIVMIVGLAIRPFHLTLALIIVGVPAFLLVLFLLAMVITLITHKRPWQ